jgi:hypothetical protein
MSSRPVHALLTVSVAIWYLASAYLMEHGR